MSDNKELTIEEKIKLIDEISAKIGDPTLPLNKSLELFKQAKVLYADIESELEKAKKELN